MIFHVGATLSSLHLRHSSFSKPSVVSSTLQLILQLFRSFTYVTSTSPTSYGEPPMIYNGLYIDLYMCLFAPYGEGNATHDRGSILLI